MMLDYKLYWAHESSFDDRSNILLGEWTRFITTEFGKDLIHDIKEMMICS